MARSSDNDIHYRWEDNRGIEKPFSRYGLPEQIVTDNVLQFTSADFANFTKGNGVKHILSAPYHPASNVQAERFVQTLKHALKSSEKSGNSLQHRLSEFLFEYRATPHSTTKESPCELFLQRSLWTRFHLMQPDTQQEVSSRQADHKHQHDHRTRHREFTPGSTVMVRVYGGPDKLTSGIVLQKLGPVTYSVEITPGKIIKQHTDQIWAQGSTTPITPSIHDGTKDDDYFDYPLSSDHSPSNPPDPPQHYPRRHWQHQNVLDTPLLNNKHYISWWRRRCGIHVWVLGHDCSCNPYKCVTFHV